VNFILFYCAKNGRKTKKRKRKRKTIKRKRMIAAHYCYCDVESWRERERADINKRRSVAGHIISKESGTLTFSFPEEKPMQTF
jgi:hypothetical protein